MNKSKVEPSNPPLEDLQGHTYQHEIGDPDWQKNATEKSKDSARRSRSDEDKKTPDSRRSAAQSTPKKKSRKQDEVKANKKDPTKD
jgi:hypothetical protein